jgi:hypothetical protein
MASLSVKDVFVGDLDGTFALAFRGSDNEVLVFQLADRIAQQDALLGLDSYSISTAGGTHGLRGGSRRRIAGAELTLTFRSDSAAALGIDRRVSLALRDRDTMEDATAALRRLGITLRPG